MNVLITGGAGYVGSTLADHLMMNGHHIRILDNLTQEASMEKLNPLLHTRLYPRFFYGELLDTAVRREMLRDIDIVVHLAAPRLEACDRVPDVAYKTIVEGTEALIRDASVAGVQQFLLASTASVYGVQDDRVCDEFSTSPRPSGLYATLKYESEKVAREYRGSMQLTVMRSATVYGPSYHIRWDLLVNQWVRQLWENKPLEIHGARQHRPVVDVRDVTSAIHLLISKRSELPPFTIYNIGSDAQNYTKLLLAQEVVKGVGRGTVTIKNEVDHRDYVVCFRKLAALGFTAKYTPHGAARSLLEILNREA